MTGLAFIALDDLTVVGRGVNRPEDVAVGRDGRVFVSDASAAVSEILSDGTTRAVGKAGGEPNGINLTEDNTAVVIANFASGALQRCDLATQEMSVLCDAVEGRVLRHPNYPILARDGSIYCSESSQSDDAMAAGVYGEADGYVFRLPPNGPPEIVADGIVLPNGLTLDADEHFLYCCRTTYGDVVRFLITDDGSLGPLEVYATFRDRQVWGEAAAQVAWADRERTAANLDLAVIAEWGFTDGCAFDAEGNLWVTLPTQNRVVAVTPDRQIVTIMHDPAGALLRMPTNVSFGGPDGCDVYIGSIARRHVVRGRSPIPGLPLLAQR